MGLLSSYKLRLERKKRRVRALRKSRELNGVVNRTADLRADDILLFCTLRNERVRLPFFMEYYRNLGVGHFLFVDNGSDDGSREYLAEQSDASVWGTTASYKSAHFGMDWLNWLLSKYGHDRWTLVVDVDEFFVYPFCDTRPLAALTDWLDSSKVRSFAAMLVDIYPKKSVNETEYHEGQNPMEVAEYFDAGNYMISRNKKYGNLWIQGGPRARAFFPNAPERAPALNKIPLVKWSRRNIYVSSTHTLLPRGLNMTFSETGGEMASGCLMHAKFLNSFEAKAEEESKRKQHFADSFEYKAYKKGMRQNPSLWCKWSEKYINWRQLEILGLMSKGNWI
ncbi:MAG: glycosyltransferase family 2 protein [Alphaproteobacteria bacterium]|nr:glycosyltransferase family 2 protein [Alphaproteobacteria bacterium]